MAEHAFLPPSAAHRWIRCALSASLEAAYPETEPTPESLEGTAAHWVVQRCLEGQPPTVGGQAPNGVVVDDEMLEAAELVVDDITTTLGPQWREVLVIERRVEIPRVNLANWGTPDYRAWSWMSNGNLLLRVWDFKYGRRVVDAFENWQLTDYTAGLLDEARNVAGQSDMTIVVDMRVIQPRSYHRDGPVRSWRVVASDLRAPINRLAMAADDALSEQPTANPHPDACRDCRGRVHCEANQRAAYFAADLGKHYAPLDMKPHDIGLELKVLTDAQALLDSRVKGLRAQAEGLINRGHLVPFWKKESAQGRLAWKVTPHEVVALGQMVGLDLTQPLDVITPTQAKAKGLPAALIASYAARPTGVAVLTEDDGKKARLTFSSSVA